MKLKKQQSGHAAILFVMCIPVLFGVFTLASDGARALQSKARLEDAAEAAVLAVSAYGEEDPVSIQTGKDYVRHYMPDMESLVEIKVEKVECSEIPECTADDNDRPFVEYRVSGRTKHESWFPGNDKTVGFGDHFDVTGSSKARKFQSSQPMDITFILDFSGSMNYDWKGHAPSDMPEESPNIPGRFSPPSRLSDLKEVVQMVTDELQAYNNTTTGPKHRVAMTGYNRRTVNKANSGKFIVRDQRIIKKKGEYDKDDVVDFTKTIKQQFKPKGEAGRIPNGDELAEFNDINYSSDFVAFNNQVKTFEAYGGTASLQGILRASQIMSYHLTKDGEEANPKQLVIILSDGEDFGHYLGQAQKLVNKGMCTNLTNAIEGGPVSADDNSADKIEFSAGNSHGLPTNTGEDPSVRIAMIGFGDGYDIHDNTGLLNCVGEENAFSAKNKDEILNLIMSLVSEEVGHLAQ
ncbi:MULTISPECIES: TadE/TadG family type IV pilus assembly protein [Aliivibrio]|uniref:VWFA domain-containing protein n=1 Tax=Aliivibrio logei 5S-186 TaxID=626086 RepID=A0ABX3AVA4_ALILO|nr:MULTISPECIES: pilus assembly protein TadG-related protein [Aliivibrio]MBB1314743.1 Tad domain-containing protein [Aliivibrio sp. SR45-2]OEF15892.1 hypothetical protein A1Q5_19430 [Aliivibrio logei 5S-186]